MSRIRGIETRAQKDVLLQTRTGHSEVADKSYGGQPSKSKDDTESMYINRLIKALPVCIASISLGANIFCYKNKGLILALPTWLKQPQNCILLKIS